MNNTVLTPINGRTGISAAPELDTLCQNSQKEFYLEPGIAEHGYPHGLVWEYIFDNQSPQFNRIVIRAGNKSGVYRTFCYKGTEDNSHTKLVTSDNLEHLSKVLNRALKGYL